MASATTVVRSPLRPAVLGLLAGALVAVVARSAPALAAHVPVREAAQALGPAAAMLAALAAGRAAPRGARAPWWVFATGAALAGAAQLALGLAARTAGGPHADVLLLALPFLAAGAVLGLKLERSRGLIPEVALDGLLVLIAAAILIERVALAPLEGAEWSRLARIALLAAAPAPALFALLLLIWREAAIPSRAAPALAGSALCFGAALAIPVFGVSPGPVTAAVGLAGWTLLALAGVLAAERPLPAVRSGMPGPMGERLRHLLVPGALLLLSIVGVQAALGPEAAPPTAVGLSVVGVLLILRTIQALRAAEGRAEERRQLEHTRALVEVSRVLAGATDVRATLNLVAEWACRLTGAPAAGVELLAEDGVFLEMKAAAGLPQEALGLRYSVDDSFTGRVVKSGQTRVTVDSSSDPSIQPASRPFLGRSAVAAVPLRYGGTPLGVLSCIRARAFTVHELELLGALADQAAIAIETARLFEQVRGLSLTDPLTGLANRRQLERDLVREFAAAERGRKVVLVLFDLDGFKPYNDRFGHLAGDAALRAFGHVLASLTRAMNLAARYGGDEFIAILSDTGLDGADVFIARIRASFEREVELLGHGPLHFSAGAAEYAPEMDGPDELVAAADRALYAAKALRSSR